MRLFGKKVTPVDLFEARVLRDAASFRAQRRYGPTGYEELPPPASREAAKALLYTPRALVYAVTESGRSACLTTWTYSVYDACVRGDLPWGDTTVVQPSTHKERRNGL